jgi:hypothetical protein
MKKTSFVVLALTVLVALAATSIYAQTFAVRANIPFDFYVGSKLMPAGDYTFDTMLGSGIGQIWSMGRHNSTTMFFEPGPLPATSDKGSVSMFFHRYDKTYFLTEVRDSYISADCMLPATHKELTLEKSASLHAPDEEVVVLARR